MVSVAQLVEQQVVSLEVVGSSPSSYPNVVNTLYEKI